MMTLGVVVMMVMMVVLTTCTDQQRQLVMQLAVRGPGPLPQQYIAIDLRMSGDDNKEW